jgi:type IV pilus assembly protein PilN
MFEKIVNMVLSELSKVSVQQEEVVGVDITRDYIRVTQLDNADDDWVLSKLGCKLIEDSDSTSIQTHPDIYINKLKEILDQNKIAKGNAAVSIPFSSAIIKVVTIPIMTEEELQEAIDTSTLWENVVQLNDALNDYSIFWQVINRDAKTNEMNLLFVASKLVDVQSYLDIVQQAGLNPVLVDVHCFAVRNALKLCKNIVENDVPTVLIEISREEQYVMIIHKEVPYILDIYVSEKDRNLLAKLAHDKGSANIVIERMAIQIAQIINTFQAKHKISSIKTLLISSTLGAHEQAIEYLVECLPEFEVLLFEVTSDLVVPANLKEKVDAELNQSALISSLGLATRKLDVFGFYQYVTGTSNINLMPNRNSVKNTEKVKFIGKWGLIFFSILFIIVSGSVFFYDQSETEKINLQMQEYNSLTLQLDNLKMELAEINRESSEINNTLAVSKDVRSNQDFLFAVLQSTIKSVPRGVSLKSITYIKGVIQLDGISVSDQNILGLIERLEGFPQISQASLINLSIEKEGKNEFKSFSVRVTLNTKSKVVATKKGGK